MTPSLGAGDSTEGDPSAAKEPAQARIEPPPAQPKPANSEAVTSDDAPSALIALAARTTKLNAADATAVTREAAGLVTVRPKPAKRKNAKERAKEKYAKDGTTPAMTAKAKSKVDKAAGAKAKKSKSAKAD